MLLTALVFRQFGVLGKTKALKCADQAGLIVDDNGNVKSYRGSGNSAIKRLVDAYVSYIGIPAKISCTMLIRKIAKENDISLDPNLIPLKNHKRLNLTTYDTSKIIAIGASTGGTEALKQVLVKMPPDIPAMVIVQHMPKNFTKSFAQRLDSLCSFKVKEGTHGDPLVRGQALIAPGNYHVRLKKTGTTYHIETNQEEKVHYQRPAVDVLFESVAKCAGKNAIGVILTGMGGDGARGLLRMKESGAKTIAQDEESCVVFGMPKEAIKLGAVDKTVTLSKIADSILGFLKK
ncbi:MAG: hypothetical protein SCALA701_15200 [Candidatus Scalindua sp.]|nr:MAG: hypothetical protein SCALA701_15200 [Candidatus Scalindua sp.]